MQEVKNKFSKKIIIFSFIVFVSFTLFKLFAIMVDMPDNCQKIENGWKCVYSDDHDVDKTKRICGQKGNISYCEGPCYPYIFCYIPFNDAGKECTNSEQCSGYCEADYDMVTNKYGDIHAPTASIKCDVNDVCVGSCSKIPKGGGCIWYFEVNNGYYIFHGGGWC